MNEKTQLYLQGVKLALRFCKANNIPEPVFMTYDELILHEDVHDMTADHERMKAIRFAKKLMPNAALVGANTGLYSRGVIFVNVKVTALPVANPGMRRWSYPGWKTDRTAVGVVAHELGHHFEWELEKQKRLIPQIHGQEWRILLGEKRKQVSSYEPKPSEAWAETMRLFILNPQLLRLALPHRFDFLVTRCSLKTSERRTWKQVLNQHPAYCAAGERWING